DPLFSCPFSHAPFPQGLALAGLASACPVSAGPASARGQRKSRVRRPGGGAPNPALGSPGAGGVVRRDVVSCESGVGLSGLKSPRSELLGSGFLFPGP